MKVLLIATEFQPTGGYGLARYTYNLAHALSANGVSVDVLSLNYLEGKSEYRDKNIQVHLITEPLPFKSFSSVSDTVLDNICILERAIAIMERNNFDIISIHDWFAALAAKALKTIYNVPLVLTVHDIEMAKQNSNLSEEQCYIVEMENYIARQSPYIITNSRFMKNEISQQYKYDAARVFTIPCAVEPNDFTTNCNLKDFRAIYALENHKIVLFVGRLSPIKGPQILMEAAHKVISQYPKTVFVFAGDGVLEEELQKTAQEYQIGQNIRFVGHLSGKVLAATYHVADCLVIPSIYEPFGMVTLESMATKTPVIASDIGGLTEIIKNGTNGFKIPPKNSDALANTIIKVLTNPELATKIAKQARQNVEKYSWQSVGAEVKTVYEKILAC